MGIRRGGDLVEIVVAVDLISIFYPAYVGYRRCFDGTVQLSRVADGLLVFCSKEVDLWRKLDLNADTSSGCLADAVVSYTIVDSAIVFGCIVDSD